MSQDKETFVPGKTTRKIKFTRENLAHDWRRNHDCPIYHALKDAGIDVRAVDPWSWYGRGDDYYRPFSPALRAASDFLCSTQGRWFGNFKRRWRLEGREFAL